MWEHLYAKFQPERFVFHFASRTRVLNFWQAIYDHITKKNPFYVHGPGAGRDSLDSMIVNGTNNYILITGRSNARAVRNRLRGWML